MKKMTSSQWLRLFALVVSIITLVTLLLIVVPLTDNFVIHTKIYGLFVVSLVFGGLFVAFSLVRKRMEIATTPLLSALLFFGLAVLASIFFTQPYPVEGLLGMGGVYVAAILIPIFAGTLLPKKSSHAIITTLAVCGVLLTVLTAAQLTGFGPAQAMNAVFNMNLPTTMVFTLIGSPLIAVQVLLTAIVGITVTTLSEKKISKVNAFLTPLLVIGLGLFIWSLLPTGQTPLALPNPMASWSIGLDSIRSPRSALIGNGPESYINNYRTFKPLWINATANWNTDFFSAANAPLTLLVTLGFLGLFTWLFLIYRTFKLYHKGEAVGKPVLAMALFLFLLLFVLPPNPIIVGVLAIVLASGIAANRDMFPLVEFRAFSLHQTAPKGRISLPAPHTEPNKAFIYANAVILTVALVIGGYLIFRAYQAQIFARQALAAAEANDGSKLYNLRQAAVRANPYMDVLRRDYALTNLVIASALANKTDITDQEKQQVTALLQQAVQEARAATALDPNDTVNWITLAQIYQNMIGVTEDAENWSIQSYIKAIETNPTDPTLRIALSSIFMTQNQFDQAIGVLQQALQLKNNFPNTYYNLAVALKQAGRLEDAKQAYTALLQRLSPDLPEYVTVAKELEELEKELTNQPKTEQTQEPTDTTPATPSITDQTLHQAGQSPLGEQNNQPIQLPPQLPSPEVPSAVSPSPASQQP